MDCSCIQKRTVTSGISLTDIEGMPNCRIKKSVLLPIVEPKFGVNQAQLVWYRRLHSGSLVTGQRPPTKNSVDRAYLARIQPCLHAQPFEYNELSPRYPARQLIKSFPATASPGMRGANFVESLGPGAAGAGTRRLNLTARAVWAQAWRPGPADVLAG